MSVYRSLFSPALLIISVVALSASAALAQTPSAPAPPTSGDPPAPAVAAPQNAVVPVAPVKLAPLTPFSTTRETLPSGLRLLVETRPQSALTAIEVRVRAGSGQETPAMSGVAHLVEHLVCKGTDACPSGSIDAALENLGGELSARTTRDDTQFGCVVPSAKWPESLGVLSEMLTRPAFRPADLNSERTVVRAEMAAARTETARFGLSLLCDSAFRPDHPYHAPLMGTEAALAHRQPEDLRAFWNRWYRPENITLVLVGKVTPDEARRLALSLFATRPALPAEEQEHAPADLVRQEDINGIERALPAPDFDGRTLTTVLLGFSGPKPQEFAQKGPVVETMLALLASGNRGRFVNRLVTRDKRAVSVQAEWLPGRLGNLILLTTTATPNDAAHIEDALQAEIRRVWEDPLVPGELEDARSEVRSRLRYECETVEGRARHLARLDSLDPTLTDEKYLARLASVSDSEVKAALHYLTPLRYVVAVLGPPPPRPAASTSGEVTP